MMKKFIVTMIIASVGLAASAQNSKVEDALRQLNVIPPNYEKAVEYITEALEHPDTKNESKTYRAVGDIYTKIAGNKDIADQYPDAAYKGIEGYIRCMELNTKSYEYKTANRALFERGAVLNAFNLGSAAYNNKEYAKALKFFELFLRAFPLDQSGLIARSKITEVYVETLAAQCAQLAGMNSVALQHYQNVMKASPKDQEPYIAISQMRLEEGDTNAAFAIVAKGREMMPDSTRLREREIGLYQISGRLDELETKIDDAIAKDPTNALLYSLRGDIYDSKKQPEKAIESYEKAIELDSVNSIKAHNNIGAQYLKLAAPLIEEYNDAGFDEGIVLEEKIHAYYKKAVPHFNYVAKHAKDPKIQYDALTTLRDLYKDMKDYKNLKVVQAEIDKLEQSAE